MRQNAEVAAQIGRVYEQFTKGDVSTINAFVSAEDGILAIGTDPREWWEGSDAVRAAWNTQLPEMHAAGLNFEPGQIQAFSEGSVAWFADQLTIRMPDGEGTPARLTGVCHQEDGAWKIVQFHFSIGAMNEDALGEELTV